MFGLVAPVVGLACTAHDSATTPSPTPSIRTILHALDDRLDSSRMTHREMIHDSVLPNLASSSLDPTRNCSFYHLVGQSLSSQCLAEFLQDIQSENEYYAYGF
jgi:hypothetical protein